MPRKSNQPKPWSRTAKPEQKPRQPTIAELRKEARRALGKKFSVNVLGAITYVHDYAARGYTFVSPDSPAELLAFLKSLPDAEVPRGK